MRRPRRERSAREQLLRDMPEKQLQQQVLDAARYLGYMCYHTYDARRSEPGFPDAILLGTGPRAGRLVVLECKTETGRLTQAQLTWLGAWMQVPAAVVMVVRPRDVDEVLQVLQGGER